MADAIADRIGEAVKKAVQDGIRTGDIAFGKTPIGTKEMAAAIIERL